MARYSSRWMRAAIGAAICVVMVGFIDLHLATEVDPSAHGLVEGQETYRSIDDCSGPAGRHVESGVLHRLTDCPICLRGLEKRVSSIDTAGATLDRIVEAVQSRPGDWTPAACHDSLIPVRGPPIA